jgi:hypothetical protein
MKRARFAVAAALVTTTMYAGAALAQTTQAPPMSPVLAGKKFTPPVKGEALIEFTQPATKRTGNTVTTTIKVRNMSAGPIARLQVTETWYDKDGTVVASSRGLLPQMIQPQEIQTITITTPFNAKMSSNNWNFTHVNGSVKVAKVKTLDDPKPAAGGTMAKPTAPKK